MKSTYEIFTLFVAAFYIATLIYLAVIDAKTLLLPDKITYPLILSGLVFNFLAPSPLSHPMDALMGAFLGFAIIWILNLAYFHFRGQHGIGMGDAKLLSAIGALLGWSDIFLCLLIASLSGVIGGLLWLKAKNLSLTQQFAFGPYLAASGIALILIRIFVD